MVSWESFWCIDVALLMVLPVSWTIGEHPLGSRLSLGLESMSRHSYPIVRYLDLQLGAHLHAHYCLVESNVFGYLFKCLIDYKTFPSLKCS